MDFAFNASALAAGGVIERGNAVVSTSSLGSIVLAPTGGEGRSAISDYYSQELKIESAETRVSGRRFMEKDPRSGKEEERFATWTSVLMKNVWIFDRVHVTDMQATMTSTRGFEDDDDHEFEVVVRFGVVTVDRKPVKIGIDQNLMGLRRYRDLERFLGSERAAAAVAKRHEAKGDALMSAFKRRKPIHVSLVERITGWRDDTLATIFVPGLGTFRFGELMLKPGQRRVNLIRVTFGPPREQFEAAAPQAMMADGAEGPTSPDEPTGGEMTVGSGEGNGTPIEP